VVLCNRAQVTLSKIEGALEKIKLADKTESLEQLIAGAESLSTAADLLLREAYSLCSELKRSGKKTLDIRRSVAV